MFNSKSKKYLEVLIYQDKGYFSTNGVSEQIREVLRKNPELANVKIRMEFFTRRCAGCGKELTASMCCEYGGKTYCGACKGQKNDFNDDWARRFQL